MNIMTRLLGILKADMHGVMDQLEDKELLIKHYLREMESDLAVKTERLQHLAGSEQRTRADHTRARREIKKLEEDLQLAVRQEKDDIARLLIRKRRIRQKRCEELRQTCDTAQEEYLQLAGLIDEQRLRYETLKVQAEAFSRQHGHHAGSRAVAVFTGEYPVSETAEEEIELELLCWKQQLQEQGGRP